MYKRQYAILAVLLIGFACIGATCGQRQSASDILGSAKGAYWEASQAFDAASKAYRLQYEATTSSDMQAKLNQDVAPIMLEATRALNLWGNVLKAGDDPAAKMAAYQAIKIRMFTALFQYGILRVE